MDIAHVLAPVNLLFGKSQGSIFVADQQAWDDIEFEVALDSGSVVHVAAEGYTPCYILDDSSKARPCEEFIVGDGGTMKKKTLNLQSDQAHPHRSSRSPLSHGPSCRWVGSATTTTR